MTMTGHKRDAVTCRLILRDAKFGRQPPAALLSPEGWLLAHSVGAQRERFGYLGVSAHRKMRSTTVTADPNPP